MTFMELNELFAGKKISVVGKWPTVAVDTDAAGDTYTGLMNAIKSVGEFRVNFAFPGDVVKIGRAHV